MFEFFQPVQPPRPVQLIAHRGMMRQGPENTAPALLACVGQGIEWAEVDVRLTRDGHHVLFHDSLLDRKTDGSGAVRDHTLAELLALDAGARFSAAARGERLLTHPQVLELARGRLNLYLDCKAVDPELLAAEILAAGMERQVVVFDKVPALQRVRTATHGRVPIMPKWRTAHGSGCRSRSSGPGTRLKSGAGRLPMARTGCRPIGPRRSWRPDSARRVDPLRRSDVSTQLGHAARRRPRLRG
jgi:glycerophosphoryl diester phosphodiesterase